jgi:di/tripeptidase
LVEVFIVPSKERILHFELMSLKTLLTHRKLLSMDGGSLLNADSRFPVSLFMQE